MGRLDDGKGKAIRHQPRQHHVVSGLFLEFETIDHGNKQEEDEKNQVESPRERDAHLTGDTSHLVGIGSGGNRVATRDVEAV